MSHAAAVSAAADPFRHVVCGVDGTEYGLAAARAAAAVTAPHGVLELVTVRDPAAGVAPDDAERWLEAALREIPPGVRTGVRLLEGRPLERLLTELETGPATLAVVGSRNRLRTAGIVAGSVTTFVLHGSRRPVLVARGEVGAAWPRRIVVGVDGGAPALGALAVARRLAARFGAELSVLAVEDDWRLETERVRAAAPELELVAGDAAHALADAAEDTDLLVVGSRGVRGLRSLGSVSERVAHDASCSVLVVRGAGVP